MHKVTPLTVDGKQPAERLEETVEELDKATAFYGITDNASF